APTLRPPKTPPRPAPRRLARLPRDPPIRPTSLETPRTGYWLKTRITRSGAIPRPPVRRRRMGGARQRRGDSGGSRSSEIHRAVTAVPVKPQVTGAGRVFGTHRIKPTAITKR